MIKISKFFFILLLFSSCSNLIKDIFQQTRDKNHLKPKKSNIKVFCKQKTNFELVGPHYSSQIFFYNTLENRLKKYQFNFIEKSVLWSLVQFNIAPNIHSPSAKIQLLYKNEQKKEEYISFSSHEDTAFPALYALNYLLKQNNSKYSLKMLSGLVDKYFNSSYKVTESLEKFLLKNKDQLAKNKVFRKSYFRGDETLKENEYLEAQKLLPIVKRLYKSKVDLNHYKVSKKLYNYKTPNIIANCNYHMELYANSIYIINKSFIRGHVYGLKEKGKSILFISSQDISTLKRISDTAFFKGRSISRSPGVCQFVSSKNRSTWMFSTLSRDPGQHLFHMIEYGIHEVNSPLQLDQIMSFSRHLFLEDPHRLVIESNRSTKKQLENILKIQTPVYNAESLGKIYAYLNNGDSSHFVIDDRREGHILCK